MQQVTYKTTDSLVLPATRKVSFSAPLKWLAAGWEDTMRTPLYSGFYGLMFVVLAYAVTLASWQSPILLLTFITGFFLVAPFIALGVYDLSRQAEQSKKLSFAKSLKAFKRNRRDMGLLVVFHALVMVAWIRLATIVGALYFVHSNTSVTVLLERLWQTGQGIEMIALLAVIGAVLAAVVFISGVVTWPMILDRGDGVITAMATSLKVVTENKAVMLFWVTMIGWLFSVGLATFYIGFILIMPLLGHASWHAYKDLVK